MTESENRTRVQGFEDSRIQGLEDPKVRVRRLARILFCGCLVAVILSGCGSAPSGSGHAGAIANEHLTYNNDVKQIVQMSCRCHVDNVSPPSRLNLSSYADMMKPSASGRQIVPTQPDSSNLYRRVSRGEMPPMGKLMNEDIRTFREWIRQGANE